MTKDIVPIAELGRRMVEHGRIRLGVKTGRSMKSIDTFRFTSADRTPIEQIAAQFGGQVKPWVDAKASPQNQFEVITTTNEIPVWVMPGGLSQSYELWSGGGCVRRCDGITCETSQQTYDADYEPVRVPCLCVAENKMQCRPYTRLSVIIPTIDFGGSWRLESKGWNAAEELPGMTEMLASLQAGGVVKGRLRLERRKSQGGRRNFVVPVLTIDASTEQIMAGAATPTAAAAIGAGSGEVPSAPELAPPSDPFAADVEPVEAELVDTDDIVITTPVDDWHRLAQLPNAPRDPVDLTIRQIEGLLSGAAKWSAEAEGKVVKA